MSAAGSSRLAEATGGTVRAGKMIWLKIASKSSLTGSSFGRNSTTYHAPGRSGIGDVLLSLGNETCTNQRRFSGPGSAKHNNDVVIGEQVPQLLDLRVAPEEEVRLVRPKASQTRIWTHAEIDRRAPSGRRARPLQLARNSCLAVNAAMRLRTRLIVHDARNSGRRRAKSTAYSRNLSKLAASGL